MLDSKQIDHDPDLAWKPSNFRNSRNTAVSGPDNTGCSKSKPHGGDYEAGVIWRQQSQGWSFAPFVVQEGSLAPTAPVVPTPVVA